MKRILCIVALLLLASTAAFSDIARPDATPKRTPKPKAPNANMTIKMDSDIDVATLRIPKSQIKQLKAALEDLEDQGDSDENAAITAEPGPSRISLIASGIFLSLALVFGGMWFARNGRSVSKGGKAAVVAITLAGIGAAATIVYANVGPPLEARSITSKLFNKDVFTPYGFASGKLRVEASQGSTYELIVPDGKNTK